MKPRITSEYQRLKKVMIHTPGEEHWQLIPWEGEHELMGPYPRVHTELRRDHQDLKQFLVNACGAEHVLEITDLLHDIFDNADGRQRQQILRDTLHTQADMYQDSLQARGIKLEKYRTEELVRDLIEGYPRTLTVNNHRLTQIIIPPKRELMWMRDSSATLPCGVVLTSMASSRRRPEPTLVRSVFKYHPMFDPDAIFMDMVEVLRKMEEDKTRCGLHEHYLLEGGNIIILDEHTLAIGVGRHEYLYSNRTTRAAFELLVQHIMDRDTAGTIQRIYLVNVPDLRGFIHLDTVFNMVGPKSAIVMPYIFGHPEPESGESPRQVLENFVAWVRGHMEATQTDLSRIPSVQHFAHAGKVEIYDRDYMRQKGRIERLPVTSRYFLDQLIADNLLDPAKIAWIGGSPDEYVSAYEHLMVALFEQHNMAGNVFTAAPYQAIAYHRNPLTADHLLDTMRRSAPDAHLERMSSNEIRTDNGGPHCLTMPLLRED